MRLAATLRSVAALSFATLAFFAVYSPASFAPLHLRAGESGLFLALSLASAAAAAHLTLPLPAFGPHANFVLPLFAALAAPYFARAAWRRLNLPLGGRARTVAASSPPRPYSLPSRVCAALEAAARARNAAALSHCPRTRAPL